MKNKIIIFCLTLLVVSSCAVRKKPKFLKVDNIKVMNISSDIITIGAEVFFENQNNIGGKLETKGIKVMVNDLEVAQVRSEMFKIPAKKEFAIPMVVDIPTKELKRKANGNFLEGLLKSLLNQDLKVQFKGKLKYKVMGYSDYYDIDETELIKLKF
ncbi:LEA type 2 family protein [Urechidicola croceus]|uniref:Late embryogenesis abundant protein LEA-2 subgroup domain-containing protein n=1 Tax=Urechidicola croceus TaxID=1850246 RepID=A0A1D8PBL1_9FLAO|nr:LEA type 2 family protein [Urechidicola croceus]AOW21948.1 hypothetical protein LPB138_15180 [Urechidicola croceus]